jgi:hypothetical protein
VNIESIVVKLRMRGMTFRTDGDYIKSRHPGRVADIIYGGIINMDICSGMTTDTGHLRFGIIG